MVRIFATNPLPAWLSAPKQPLRHKTAGRALRSAVLWRKGCFGADSAAGNSLVAKILTVAAPSRQQEKHLLRYLTDAVSAYRGVNPAPSLLPA
jgi:hypothetical protein